MMEFARWVFFCKDNVTICKEIEKYSDKEDCDN